MKQFTNTFSSTWATEVEVQFSVRVGIVVKSDRCGQRGSWAVYFRVLDQRYATGYKLFLDGLDVQDDAWEAVQDLMVQLERKGFDVLTGQAA